MERVEELRKLAEGLIALKPTKDKQFCMSLWHVAIENREGEVCGFAACAIGWLPVLVPESKLIGEFQCPMTGSNDGL